MADVIAVGEILVEIMTVHKDQPLNAPGMLAGPFPSGAPAIFIDQAARMGASCGIIARVGDDDFGMLNIKRLQSDGVDTSQILTDSGNTTGTAFVTYFTEGSRKFVFHFAKSAAGCLSPQDVNSQYVRQARYLHVMGCSLTAGDSLREAVMYAVRLAREYGLTISFDPNIRPELLQNNSIRQVFSKVLEDASILLTSPGEMQTQLGMGCEEGARSLLEKGMGIIVLKNGGKGVRVMTRGTDFSLPPLPVVEVDPTGAGDCFDGAFIACLAQGMDIRQAATAANAAGALSVTKKGPMEGAHGREDVFAFLGRFGG